MSSGMATEKRLRLSFDADDEAIRRAVYIAAAMQGRTHNEILNDLIREHLAEYVALARKAISRGEPSPRPKRDRSTED
jgi:hypothetical protein